MDQDHMERGGADRAACLEDLPPELLDMIGGFLGSLRDLAAWAVATGLTLPTKLFCAAAQAHGHHERLVEAGAPLAVVAHLLHCHALYPHPPLVPMAARGGRVDVIQHMWSAVVATDSNEGLRVDHSSFRLSPISKDGCMDAAARAAVDADHKDVLCWLLAKCRQDTRSWSRIDDTVKTAVKFGLKKGYADVVREAHAVKHVFKCVCDSTCARRVDKAVVADDPHVLAMLAAANCRAAGRVSNRHLGKAVAQGSLGVAQWLAGVIKGHVVVDGDSMQKAASRGHVATLALAHDNGFCECTPGALLDAAGAGHLDVLVWAAGEGERPPARPLAPWYGAHLAYAAAATGRLDVLEWMAARPDAHKTLGVGVARKALVSGAWACAVMLHDRGVAPFETWDALATAARHNDLHVVCVVAKRGGRCDVATWIAALCRPKSGIMAFLCGHFGIVGLQEAVDAVAGLACGREPVEWLAANAPGVCVTQLVQQHTATKVQGAWRPPAKCSCAACLSPAAAT
ncbi:hypothetical protein psal_cds_1139 [Pandoravirus salinus]|uniref:Ankyrin repeat domain containing protein n=1 Tax=Pandoravirus salinus TaxID=1349410 RepID=S4VXJ9_9VIRU|nr:hypothetical protein psal_cds_1139 [Pandoravirus salinus]AGO85394.1 hypothetical protein psal_cds_1139 [Pandoravirus salinus]